MSGERRGRGAAMGRALDGEELWGRDWGAFRPRLGRDGQAGGRREEEGEAEARGEGTGAEMTERRRGWGRGRREGPFASSGAKRHLREGSERKFKGPPSGRFREGSGQATVYTESVRELRACSKPSPCRLAPESPPLKAS